MRSQVQRMQLHSRTALVRQWLPLTGLLGLMFAGCTPDHRISFSRFLETQRGAATAEADAPDAAEPRTADVDELLAPYRVGPSDVLGISFAGMEQLGLVSSVQVRVDRNGSVDLPVVGLVDVADRELEDVEDAIAVAYVPSIVRSATVHVTLVEPYTVNVLVVGAVTEPGLIPLRRDERNTLFAIVGAGGVSDAASGFAFLRRIREPDEEYRYNLRDPRQLRAVLSLDPLEDGDIISVEAAQPNTIYVGGLVNLMGPQSYPQDTEVTILQAFAAAGGVRTDVFPREGTLVRRTLDGTDVHVKLDLNRLACGQDPNIALAPGDILWVPETWETRVQDFINRNIYARAGISVNYNVTGVEYLNRAGQQSGRFGGSQEDISDPFGFLTRASALQGLQGALIP